MAKNRLRTTILKGNNERLIELAGTYGLTVENFLIMLAETQWHCLNKDVVKQLKIMGRAIPADLEFIDNPKVIPITDINTEPLMSIYLNRDIIDKLDIKVKEYGLRNIGLLIDKICCEPLQFHTPDLFNGIKYNGGKNGKRI